MYACMERVCKLQRVVIALGIILACCPYVVGLDPSLDINQYAHTTWRGREGFSKGIIFAIAQTPDGYLWLGTEFGLLRFNGVRSVPWEPPAGQLLPSSEVRALFIARDGNLWIGTLKGLASWKDGKLTQYAELAGQVVSSILEDREGTIWAGGWATSTGRVCAIKNGSTKCYGEDGSLGHGVYSLYEDSGGSLWLGAVTGLWRWKPGPPKLYPMLNPTPGINSLIGGDNGALLIAMSEGIRRLVERKSEVYPLPGVGGQFKPTRLLRDRNGGLWIGTADRGLLHVHQGRTDQFSRSDGLSDDYVEDLFEDREGNIWVATGDGLDRFRDFAVHTISVRQGLSNVSSVLAAKDGSVWLGSTEGLNRWSDGQITIYRKRTAQPVNVGAKREQKFSGLAAAGESRVLGAAREITNSGLPDEEVRALTQDNRGRIWVTTSGGLFYFDDKHFIRVTAVPDGQVFSSAGDSVGNLWISDQDQGLIHLLGENVVERIPWARLGRRGMATALFPDPAEGGLWLGFFEGGVAYFKDGQVRASYAGADGLGLGRVSGLQLDRDGTLWAATEGGLSRVKNSRVATLTSKNGLPCNAVKWVVEDDAHSFWLYMACGLVRITRPDLESWVRDPNRKVQATVFDSSDGVKSHSFTSGTTPRVAKSADGRLWFLPLDGVSVIDPQRLPSNKLPPPVRIEQIAADGQTYDPFRGLRLPPRVRDLTIDYTALSLVAPEKVHFRFKLEGQDEDWREVVNDRRVQYSNLGPGHYRFRVTACNNSGVWNEEGDVLDFSIAPAYWQTNWFRALCVAAFVAILWGAHRLRVRVLEERQALLERHQGEISALNERLMKAQEEERMRIAGELHDGVLQKITSLALELATATIGLPADSEPKAEVREVEKKLIEVGTEIRQLSHELHPAVLQEAGLPAALSSYCEEFSKLRGIPIAYQADESVEELSPGAALCIYRIAQEALGNVAKHAHAKQVGVRLTRSDTRVCLVVSDDGVGFNADGSGKAGGLGLINMRERVRQLNGTFEFDSAPGRGTTVKAEVPFRPAS